MPTPPKPYKVLEGENKSHRTKAELKLRKEGEESLATSEKMKERRETKKNKVAHKEYERVSELLEKIEKNDALFESVINRYCILQAECREVEERRTALEVILQNLKDETNNIPQSEKVEFLCELATGFAKIAAQINNCDKILAQKRKMLFEIEKENIMTIASQLRVIPKKVDKEENPLLKALGKI